jgi:hypothetical protein
MAINRNLNFETTGIGRADAGAAPPAKSGAAPIRGASPLAAFNPLGVAAAAFPAPIASAPAASAPAVSTSSTGPRASAPSLSSARLGAITAFDPGTIFLPPRAIDFGPLIPTHKTTTQIAQAAVNQLTGAAPALVREGVSTIKNKSVAAAELINYLERKTRVGEVLNELAHDWSTQTRQDFAEAFQMASTDNKLPVMDAMVSISILNDPELRAELQAENTTEPSAADLLENRRIVWQWPQAGTPFTPPYILMVAVERQDTTQAQNVVHSILGDLVDFEGYKIPRVAAQKISGGVAPGRAVLSTGVLSTLANKP